MAIQRLGWCKQRRRAAFGHVCYRNQAKYRPLSWLKWVSIQPAVTMCLRCEWRIFRTLQRVDMVIRSQTPDNLEPDIPENEWLDDSYWQDLTSQSYFIREIPNKPPPPYTPPKQSQATSPVVEPPGIERKPEVALHVLLPVDDLKELVRIDLEDIYNHLQRGTNAETIVLKSSTMPADLSVSVSLDRYLEVNCISYRRLIYELSKEVALKFFATQQEPPRPVWMKSKRIAPRRVVSPFTTNKKEWMNTVQRQVWNAFDLDPSSSRSLMPMTSMRFGRKRQDKSDDLLVRELRVEEQGWVSYDQDEVTVKNQVTSSIFHSLLDECCTVLKSIQTRMNERQSSRLER